MGLFGIQFPWETPEGEGFIAPWTDKVEAASGQWIQQAGGDLDLVQEQFIDLFQAAPSSGLPSGGPSSPLAGGTPLLPSATSFSPSTVPTMFGGAGQMIVKTAEPVVQQSGLGGILSAIPEILATLGAVGTLGVARLKMPWETPEGEGIIAPWTQQRQLESGLWGQEGVQYQGAAPGVGAMAGVAIVKTWTNAARNGATPATVAFALLSNGKMVSRSLVDGSVKTWRPKKHIVISNNPRISNIRKLDRVHKKVAKTLRKFVPKSPTYGQLPRNLLSAAEKKLIKG